MVSSTPVYNIITNGYLPGINESHQYFSGNMPDPVDSPGIVVGDFYYSFTLDSSGVRLQKINPDNDQPYLNVVATSEYLVSTAQVSDTMVLVQTGPTEITTVLTDSSDFKLIKIDTVSLTFQSVSLQSPITDPLGGGGRYVQNVISDGSNVFVQLGTYSGDTVSLEWLETVGMASVFHTQLPQTLDDRGRTPVLKYAWVNPQNQVGEFLFLATQPGSLDVRIVYSNAAPEKTFSLFAGIDPGLPYATSSLPRIVGNTLVTLQPGLIFLGAVFYDSIDTVIKKVIGTVNLTTGATTEATVSGVPIQALQQGIHLYILTDFAVLSTDASLNFSIFRYLTNPNPIGMIPVADQLIVYYIPQAQ